VTESLRHVLRPYLRAFEERLRERVQFDVHLPDGRCEISTASGLREWVVVPDFTAAQDPALSEYLYIAFGNALENMCRQQAERDREPEPAPDAPPDLFGDVLGWRRWNVSPQGDLISTGVGAVWRPGANHALCDQGLDHKAPQLHCACGWYGLHEYPGSGFAVGLIRAWGKIAVHVTGFRAEWAEVVCLVGRTAMGRDDQRRLQRAANYYEVPIMGGMEKAMAYAREQGYDFVSANLRPKGMPVEDWSPSLPFPASRGALPSGGALGMVATGPMPVAPQAFHYSRPPGAAADYEPKPQSVGFPLFAVLFAAAGALGMLAALFVSLVLGGQ